MRRPVLRRVSLLLSAIVIATPWAACQQALLAAEAQAAPGAAVSYVTPEATAGALAFPQRVLKAPGMEFLPLEVFTAAGLKEVGIDPVAIEQLLVEVEFAGLPRVGVVARFTEPVPTGPILGPLWKRTVDDKFDGVAYRRAGAMMDVSIYRADDRTLIVAHDDLLRKMVAQQKKALDGTVAKRLADLGQQTDLSAVVSVPALRPYMAMGLGMAPLPPELSDVRVVGELIDRIEVSLRLTAQGHAKLAVQATDAAAAERLCGIMDQAIEFGQKQIRAEAQQHLRSADPIEQALGRYQQRIGGQAFEGLKLDRDGAQLSKSVDWTANPQVQIAVMGVLLGLLLPAVQSAREAARKAASTNNMKQLALAMFMYESAQQHFPARASFDQEGRPLLSWRVHLLPYIDQNALYKQFHLDEPWDSPHNRTLIDKMPAILRSPNSAVQGGKTVYLGVQGPGLFFDGSKGRGMAEIRDGTSNTIMLVEVDDERAVPWTKPADWEADLQQPTAGVGHLRPGAFIAAMADGSVRTIVTSMDSQILRALLTVAGGEVVGAF